MSRIFLSHSAANGAEAIAVRDWMVRHGWNDIFLDLDPERGLKAGERWQAALKAAVDRCELVIFLVSPAWTASKWCLAEFLLAKSLNKRVFGVIVEPTPFSTIPVEMTAEWQLVDLTAGERDYHATVTLPPGDKTASVALANDGLNRLRIGLQQAGLDARYFAWPPANDPSRPPYRGLKPLETDDAGIFFGRDAPAICALDHLRGLREAAPPRLLVILGASGAGKSSFLRAGLVPRLARDDRNFHVLPIVRPERAVLTGETGLLHAFEGAFRAVKMAMTRADLRTAIDEGVVKLRPLLQTLAAKVTPSALEPTTEPKPPILILAIDQGEELFLAEGQDESRIFLALLRELLIEDAPAVTALFTIRSDSYERLQEAKELEGIRKVPFDLGPVPKGSYAEVIKGPAQRLEGTARALRIDYALIDALLDDIEKGGAKDALPLLAFTLERLYDEFHAGGHLKLEHYNRLGRVEGSIEAAVERAFKAADADPKIPRDRQARLSLLRRGLIPWLAGIDPDTAMPRRRIARLSEIPDEAQPLMQTLVEQRLLATDFASDTREITIEPAHEALLRQWGLLKGWLVEDLGALGSLEGVKRATRDWCANAKGRSWLTHTGSRLEEAERTAMREDFRRAIGPSELEYLSECRTEARLAVAIASISFDTAADSYDPTRVAKRLPVEAAGLAGILTSATVLGMAKSLSSAEEAANRAQDRFERIPRWEWFSLAASVLSVVFLILPLHLLFVLDFPTHIFLYVQYLTLLVCISARLWRRRIGALNKWRDAQCYADEQRTRLFRAILAPQVPGAMPLQLEYFVNGLFQPQLDYFTRQAAEKRAAPSQMRRWRWLGYLMVVATGSLIAGMTSELAITFGVPIPHWLAYWPTRNRGPWMVALALVALTLQYANMRSQSSPSERSPQQFAFLASRLREFRENDLRRARAAAAANNCAGVHDFTDKVMNELDTAARTRH